MAAYAGALLEDGHFFAELLEGAGCLEPGDTSTDNRHLLRASERCKERESVCVCEREVTSEREPVKETVREPVIEAPS